MASNEQIQNARSALRKMREPIEAQAQSLKTTISILQSEASPITTTKEFLAFAEELSATGLTVSANILNRWIQRTEAFVAAARNRWTPQRHASVSIQEMADRLDTLRAKLIGLEASVGIRERLIELNDSTSGAYIRMRPDLAWKRVSLRENTLIYELIDLVQASGDYLVYHPLMLERCEERAEDLRFPTRNLTLALEEFYRAGGDGYGEVELDWGGWGFGRSRAYELRQEEDVDPADPTPYDLEELEVEEGVRAAERLKKPGWMREVGFLAREEDQPVLCRSR